MRLTTVQREVLEAMANGTVVHRCVHTNINTPDSYFYGYSKWRGGNGGNAHIRSTTVKKLLALKLIEDVEKPEWRWRGSRYIITDAGRMEAKEK